MEHSNSIEKAAGKDGGKVLCYRCVHGFPQIISISDNEELEHNSLMHEKKGLHRAEYTQVMVILIKLTSLQEVQEGAQSLLLLLLPHYSNVLCKINSTITSFLLR